MSTNSTYERLLAAQQGKTAQVDTRKFNGAGTGQSKPANWAAPVPKPVIQHVAYGTTTGCVQSGGGIPTLRARSPKVKHPARLTTGERYPVTVTYATPRIVAEA